MAVGDRIAEMLLSMNISQKELAGKLNIALSTLNGYVKNHREPDYQTLKNIAAHLNVTCDYLLEYDYVSNGACTNDELDLLESYRRLNPEQKELISAQISLMRLQNIKKKKKSLSVTSNKNAV